MRARPQLDDFLSGGTADVEVSKRTASVVPMPAPKVAREQKVFRLPVSLTEDLRRTVFRYSAAQNRRVTETEIVEIAIRAFIDSSAI
jgi:hypothetical protein